MRVNLTKLLVPVMALLLMLGAAACGSGEEPTADTGEDSEAGAEEEPADGQDDEDGDGEEAAEFPEQDVEVVNPFEGGNYEAQSRRFAPILEEHLPGDHAVGVRNVPGAGGVIGYNEAWNAEPDGHTLSIVSTHSDALRYLEHEDQADWHPTGWQWVGGWFPEIPGLGVRPDLGIEGWEEFIDHGASEGITFGTPGQGSLNHGQQILFSDVTGIDAEFVHYGSTGEVRTAMGRGEIDAYLAPASTIGEFVKDDEAEWVGIIREGEDPIFPDAPTLDDLDVDDEGRDRLIAATGAVRGLVTQEDVPQERLQILRDSFYEAAQTDEWTEFLENEGIAPEAVHGEELQKFMADAWPQLEEMFRPLLSN